MNVLCFAAKDLISKVTPVVAKTSCLSKHRTNSYFTNRRSRRIVRTPPPPSDEPTSSEANTELIYDDENETDAVNANDENDDDVAAAVSEEEDDQVEEEEEETDFDMLILKSNQQRNDFGHTKQQAEISTSLTSLDLDLYDYLSRKNLMNFSKTKNLKKDEDSSSAYTNNHLQQQQHDTNVNKVSETDSISFENKLKKWNLISTAAAAVATTTSTNNDIDSENNSQSSLTSKSSSSFSSKGKEKQNLPPVFKYLNKNIINSMLLNEIKHTNNNTTTNTNKQNNNSEEFLVKKLRSQTKLMYSNTEHVRYVSNILDEMISNVVALVESQELSAENEATNSNNETSSVSDSNLPCVNERCVILNIN